MRVKLSIVIREKRITDSNIHDYGIFVKELIV